MAHLLTLSPFLLDDDDRFAPGTSSSFSTLRSRSRARSKVIEVPQPKHFSTAPARAPPEPLSARGDVPE